MNDRRKDTYAAFAELFLPPRGGDARPALDLLGLDPATPIDGEFLKAFGHGFARGWPPYESEYGNAHLFQQAEELADISGFYAAWGLTVAGERLDHVSIELEFMAFLAAKEALAHAPEDAEVTREAQRKFLAEHLGRWIPAFTARLEEGAPSPFYRSAARALRDFVTEDMRRFKAEVVPLRSIDLRPAEPTGEMDCGGCVFGEPS